MARGVYRGWARARKSTTVRNSWRHQLRVEAPSTYFSTRETSAIVLRGAWIVLEYRASALQSICLLLLRVRPSYWSPHVPNTRENKGRRLKPERKMKSSLNRLDYDLALGLGDYIYGKFWIRFRDFCLIFFFVRVKNGRERRWKW